MKLDEIDGAILAALHEDVRLTNKALAERAGLSQSATLERLRKLESEGVVRGYREGSPGRPSRVESELANLGCGDEKEQGSLAEALGCRGVAPSEDRLSGTPEYDLGSAGWNRNGK